MVNLVERFELWLARKLPRRIARDLRRQQGQPAVEIVATKHAQPSQVIFEQHQPEVAQHIVDLVVGKRMDALCALPNSFAQPLVIAPSQLSPRAIVTSERRAD